jgi:hypothetical protein
MTIKQTPKPYSERGAYLTGLRHHFHFHHHFHIHF